ncbi:hypothetical protein BS78_03G127600 [Paspalum vaginatum]|nr:hypothetical protein BS78_03G127600 [Paspalum vaginatum]
MHAWRARNRHRAVALGTRVCCLAVSSNSPTGSARLACGRPRNEMRCPWTCGTMEMGVAISNTSGPPSCGLATFIRPIQMNEGSASPSSIPVQHPQSSTVPPRAETRRWTEAGRRRRQACRPARATATIDGSRHVRGRVGWEFRVGGLGVTAPPVPVLRPSTRRVRSMNGMARTTSLVCTAGTVVLVLSCPVLSVGLALPCSFRGSTDPRAPLFHGMEAWMDAGAATWSGALHHMRNTEEKKKIKRPAHGGDGGMETPTATGHGPRTQPPIGLSFLLLCPALPCPALQLRAIYMVTLLTLSFETERRFEPPPIWWCPCHCHCRAISGHPFQVVRAYPPHLNNQHCSPF